MPNNEELNSAASNESSSSNFELPEPGRVAKFRRGFQAIFRKKIADDPNNMKMRSTAESAEQHAKLREMIDASRNTNKLQADPSANTFMKAAEGSSVGQQIQELRAGQTNFQQYRREYTGTAIQETPGSASVRTGTTPNTDMTSPPGTAIMEHHGDLGMTDRMDLAMLNGTAGTGGGLADSIDAAKPGNPNPGSK